MLEILYCKSEVRSESSRYESSKIIENVVNNIEKIDLFPIISLKKVGFGTFNDIYRDNDIVYRVTNYQTESDEPELFIDCIRDTVINNVLYNELNINNYSENPFLHHEIFIAKKYYNYVFVSKTKYIECSLSDYIKNVRIYCATYTERYNYMLEIIFKHLDYLYVNYKFIHGDLSYTNIRVSYNHDFFIERIYLIDLGFSRVIINGREYCTNNGELYRKTFNQKKDKCMLLYGIIKYLKDDFFIKYVYETNLYDTHEVEKQMKNLKYIHEVIFI